MLSFCPQCGQTIGQAQIVGQTLICQSCKADLGVVEAPPKPVLVDAADELIRQGKAARCPACQQLVEVRAGKLVPHFAAGPPRKMCPGAGKEVAASSAPAAAAPAPPPPAPARSGGKDLSKYMTRDAIKVIACMKDANPTIEELTLEYLDKSDRVRLQIDALRDILGQSFQMRDYPAALQRPHLAIWGNAAGFVVAKKHPQGGYQTMTDADITQALADLKQARQQF